MTTGSEGPPLGGVSTINLSGMGERREGIGAWAKYEIKALREKCKTEERWSLWIGLVPTIIVALVVFHSVYQISYQLPWNLRLFGLFDLNGIYNKEYQQWFIGLFTFFAAGWVIYIARMQLLEKRHDDREKVINYILSAEMSAKTMVDNFTTAFFVDGTPPIIYAGFFNVPNIHDFIPATLSISQPIYEIHDLYLDLRRYLARREELSGRVPPGFDAVILHCVVRLDANVWKLLQ